MNIIVIGHNGQLAWELAQLHQTEHKIICLGRDHINIFNTLAIIATLRNLNASAVINASAYTAVDQAENEPDKAFAINAVAVKNLAEACKTLALHLVHISTDFVFNGKQSIPYLPTDPVKPLGVYGESKVAGENYIAQIFPENSTIIRTSWVYSSHGNNFVKTILRLLSEKSELGIISDQIGSPTYAQGLAQLCLLAVIKQASGIYHWTDAGVASWYDFAVAIQEIALEKNIITTQIPINPIQAKEYPLPAKRPSFSVLDKSSCIKNFPEIALVHWRSQLITMMDILR